MAEEQAETRQIPYRQLFPWLTLFRGFRIALDAKKMALGAAGVAMMLAGWTIISTVVEGIGAASNAEDIPALEMMMGDLEAQSSYEPSVLGHPGQIPDDLQQLIAPAAPSNQRSEALARLVTAPLHPARFLVTPFTHLLSLDSADGWTGSWQQFGRTLATVLAAIWAVLTWAFFGGAISRLASVQVARDEKPGFGETLRFVREKYLSYAAAPIFPFGVVAIFLFFCFLGGGLLTLTRWMGIPVVGSVIDGVFAFLAFLASFVMAILLVGLAAGWPLMWPTIGAEGSDSFDALSRSYSYVYQRPWNYLFYSVLAILYGAVVIAFVVLFSYLVVYLCGWAVSSGAGREAAAAFFQVVPDASGWSAVADALAPREQIAAMGALSFSQTTSGQIAGVLGAIWLYLLFFLVLGFVYSYFWTAATIIYFLLRRDVDATDMDEVYLEEEEAEEFGMPPHTSEQPERVEASASEGAGSQSESAGPSSNPGGPPQDS